MKFSHYLPRPHIPLLLTASVVLFLSVFAGDWFIALAIEQSELTKNLSLITFCLLLVLLCFVLVPLFRKKVRVVRSTWFWLTVFVLLGLCLSLSQHDLLVYQRNSIPDLSKTQWSYEALEDTRISSYGKSCLVEISDDVGLEYKVSLSLPNDISLLVGDKGIGQIVLKAPNENDSYLDARGIHFRATMQSAKPYQESNFETVLTQVRKTFLTWLSDGNEEAYLLRALLVGERSELFESGFYRDVKVLGLAHLVAVSGAHLVVVSSFLSLVLRFLKCPFRFSVVVQVLFLFFYVALVGFPISCLRAACMSLFSLLSIFSKRRSSSLNALGLTILFFIVIDPTCVQSLSFQLSVAATLGIVIFTPLFSLWFKNSSLRCPSFIVDTLSMTSAALLFTLPISIAEFALVPLLSPVANLIATPFLTLLLVLGIVLVPLGQIIPLFHEVIIGFSGVFITCIEVLASLPITSLACDDTFGQGGVISALIAFMLWLWWPTKITKRMGFGVLCLCLVLCLVPGVLAWQKQSGDRIIMLDVSQGDAFIIQSNHQTLLIDTGNQTSLIYQAFARNNIYHLDGVMISHADDDHCGSLKDISSVSKIDELFVSRGTATFDDASTKKLYHVCQEILPEQNVHEIGSFQTMKVGNFKLSIIAPDELEEGGNADSICFLADLDYNNDGNPEWRSLFCGDAEAHQLKKLVDDKILGKVDVYKVGHHGSKAALDEEVAAVLKPKIALVSVGENNRYGHPNEETLERLRNGGARIFRTDQSGDVICDFKAKDIQITTLR